MSGYAAGGSVRNWVAVTPHDTNYIRSESNPAEYLRVGGAGNIVVTQQGGTNITFNGVVAGEYLPVKAIRVLSAGTTATNIAAAFK